MQSQNAFLCQPQFVLWLVENEVMPFKRLAAGDGSFIQEILNTCSFALP